jgi:hypothetical protein
MDALSCGSMVEAFRPVSVILRAGISAASAVELALAASTFKALPHCGQYAEPPRTDAPQSGHRRAISGSIN